LSGIKVQRQAKLKENTMLGNIETKSLRGAPVDEANASIISAKLHDREYDERRVLEFQKYIADVVMQVVIADPRLRVEYCDALLGEIKEGLGGCDLEGKNLSDDEKMTVLSDPNLISSLVDLAHNEIMRPFDERLGNPKFLMAVSEFAQKQLNKDLFS
jgi:hypothetical protein